MCRVRAQHSHRRPAAEDRVAEVAELGPGARVGGAPGMLASAAATLNTESTTWDITSGSRTLIRSEIVLTAS